MLIRFLTRMSSNADPVPAQENLSSNADLVPLEPLPRSENDPLPPEVLTLEDVPITEDDATATSTSEGEYNPDVSF